MTIKIIDVSKHNGSLYWSKIKKDGIDGIMIRAGYGWQFHKDPYMDEFVEGCRKNKIPYGFYCYSYATTVSQAVTECYGFLKTIKGLNPELPVVIDTEDADGWRHNNSNPSWRTLAAMLKKQLTIIEEAGYYAMWYANRSWAVNLYQCDPSLRAHDLWLAHWGVSEPSLPCGLWQYTEKGPKYGDGIDQCDMNIAYKDYPEIIKAAGLNEWPKEEKKVSSIKVDTVICYKNDGDFANVMALFNSLYGLVPSVCIQRGDPTIQAAHVIQVGGAKVKGANVVLSGADRREVLVTIAKYVAERR